MWSIFLHGCGLISPITNNKQDFGEKIIGSYVIIEEIIVERWTYLSRGGKHACGSDFFKLCGGEGNDEVINDNKNHNEII